MQNEKEIVALGFIFLVILMVFPVADAVYSATPAETFPTSLHARGPSNGRENIFEQGVGKLIKAPFRESACQSCHPKTYADGTAVTDDYQPGCRDCHQEPGDSVPQERCLECHTIGFDRFSVHREAGLICMEMAGFMKACMPLMPLKQIAKAATNR